MNAKGSKSAPTKKSPKAPAVTLDSGTTVVLPNPADAPAPVKPGTNAVGIAGAEPTTAPAKPTKGRSAKPAKPAKSQAGTPAAAPGSLRAIGDGWLASLKAAGHTPSTISSYGNDLAIAYEHFGDARVAAEITERQIASFDACALVTKKKSGKGKAMPTILKTRRALRLALTWEAGKKLIKAAPYPAA